MSGHRIARVEELMREELSEIIQQHLKDPRIGFTTVTRVKVSNDLSHAKVFISVMGDAQEKEKTMSGISSASGYIQRLLAGRIKIKFLPHLEFLLDDSLDRGFRIEEILKKLEAEQDHE